MSGIYRGVRDGLKSTIPGTTGSSSKHSKEQRNNSKALRRDPYPVNRAAEATEQQNDDLATTNTVMDDCAAASSSSSSSSTSSSSSSSSSENESPPLPPPPPILETETYHQRQPSRSKSLPPSPLPPTPPLPERATTTPACFSSRKQPCLHCSRSEPLLRTTARTADPRAKRERAVLWESTIPPASLVHEVGAVGLDLSGETLYMD